jgi:hypothetical protein
MSDKTNIRMRPITVYDKVNIVIDKGMAGHYRAYKFKADIHYTPWRYLDFFYPYTEKDTFHGTPCGFVHLNQLSENKERKRIIGNPNLVDVCPKAKLWILPDDKMAWSLTDEEYNNLLKTEPTCSLENYEKFFIKS